MSVKMSELFGGKDALEENALYTVFLECAKTFAKENKIEGFAEDLVYPWLERMSKVSLTLEIIEKLHELGFLIVPKTDLNLFTAKVNAVTAYYRHGQMIPEHKLIALANGQIEFEKKFGLL